MPLTAGQRIGPYEITAALGAGGMGEVYRAKDSKLKREVALKVLPADVANDRERMARFQREAEVLASLNHPNIAAIYGIEEGPAEAGHHIGDRTMALVMELVEGEDLAERLKRGAIPIDEALPIAKQIVEALEAAHEQGIIHRDLKPANVKVRPDGTVKVLDFGLAKALDEPKGSSPQGLENSPTITAPAMTMHGMILGTAAYMSPEQAKGRVVDQRADNWAFGVVLFEMLTATRAFKGDDVTDIITSVMRDTPDWSALPPATPLPIRTLMRRALEKDPRRRLPHIAVARLEIDDAMTSTGELVRDSRDTGRAGATWRERLAWALAAIAAAVAIGLLVTRPVPPGPATAVRFSVAPPAEAGVLQMMASFAVSPDGEFLVYSAKRAAGAATLWLHSFRDGTARELPGTAAAGTPFWSPDGQAVAFQSEGKLKRLDITSGTVQVICECPGGHGTWNDDGVILFANRLIYRVPARGGTPEAITRLEDDGDIRHVRPHFLPDGQRFLFSTVDRDDSKSTLRQAALGSMEARTVGAIASGAEYVAAGHLVYVADGALLARPFDVATASFTGDASVISDQVMQRALDLASFSISRTGTLVYDATDRSGDVDLVWVNRDGRPGETFASSSGVHSLALAPSDRLAAVELIIASRPGGIWLLDADRGTRTRFTFDTSQRLAAGHPVWSPDLSQIAFFVGMPGAQTTLMLKAVAGTRDAEPLLTGDTSRFTRQPTDWSADGRLVIFEESGPDKTWDLGYVRLDDRRPMPILQSRFAERQGQLSPDGRYLAYTSTESGQEEVYVITFPDAARRWTISGHGGTSPRWTRDGRELLFIDLDGTLTSVPLGSGAAPQPEIPKPLFALGAVSTDGWAYAVGKDGRLLVVRPNQRAAQSGLIVLMNLPQLLGPADRKD